MKTVITGFRHAKTDIVRTNRYVLNKGRYKIASYALAKIDLYGDGSVVNWYILYAHVNNYNIWSLHKVINADPSEVEYIYFTELLCANDDVDDSVSLYKSDATILATICDILYPNRKAYKVA